MDFKESIAFISDNGMRIGPEYQAEIPEFSPGKIRIISDILKLAQIILLLGYLLCENCQRIGL